MEDIILYAGFVLMFAALSVVTITLTFFPVFGNLSRMLINPGAVLVGIILLKRLPRWIKDSLKYRKTSLKEFQDALQATKEPKQ